MILVIDIGNTSTTFGLYADGRVGRVRRMDTVDMKARVLASFLRDLIGRSRISGVCAASVVPRTIDPVGRVVQRVTGRPVFWVNHRTKLGIPITYPKPSSIGADRLANACGAAARYGTPAIVADFGTALTFDIISRTKGYIGGIIAPGLPLMFDYLADRTALLPHIKPGPVNRPVGKNTKDAMRLGAQWGYRGMVKEILQNLVPYLDGKVHLCATGGYAAWVIRGLDLPIRYDKDLTLYGLGRIYELNR